ncbi:hypothetical protein, partial [Klebsiella pneumoniae]|uniref:hypothetical protein n=1 Tax=Klebsiella pneumoniae TaxID=573 RepID=UPI001C12CC11
MYKKIIRKTSSTEASEKKKKKINNLNAITATTTTPINVSITLNPVINIKHNISYPQRAGGTQGVSDG